MIILLGLLFAAAATGEAPQLTLYVDRFYRGDVQSFGAAQPQLPQTLTPQSLKISGRWEACSEPRFKGRCIEIDRDYPVAVGLDANFRVASLRPLAAGAGAGKPAVSVSPGGTSIIGVASAYWPAPTYGSERVLACPSGKTSLNCARETAEDLCRRAGYRALRYWQLQTVDERVYLADVLCIRSDDK